MKQLFLLFSALCCMMAANAQTKELAVLLYGTDGTEESYLLTEDISISFEDEAVWLMVNDEKVCKLNLDDENIVDVDFRTAFIMDGIKDPNKTDDYYSTFFSSEGAYKLPEEGVTAYAATAEGEQLKMKAIGNVIAQGEPVVLKATTDSFVLMPTAYGTDPTEPNALAGTDEEQTLGTGDYALSVGENGIGFYPWDGNTIPDNNAYLPLGSLSSVSSLAFLFEGDDPTGINTPYVYTPEDGAIYNLSGMRVGKVFKGIVIKNGNKTLQK